jgi:putative hydrolase of the HAD superfamily
MPGRYDAVTFDCWNTLVWEEAGHIRSRRAEACAGLLEEAGFAMERSLLDAVLDTTWSRYLERWTAGQQYQAVHAAEELVAQLGFDLPPVVRAELIEVFTHAGRGARLHLAEGAADCLEDLRAAGMRLGIICDVGMTPSTILREHLAELGVLDLFDHWSFSDEIGHYKPAPEIFGHALAGLGVEDPSRAAHIGDIRRTDVAGAIAAGMTAIRYTGVSDDQTQPEPEGHHVVASHAEIPPLLLG